MITIIAILAGLGLIALAVFNQMRGGILAAQQRAPMTETAKATIKISLAGIIFLILLWILVPEFIGRHHKEIAVMVVTMVMGEVLLGIIKTDWVKNSTRKILRAHYTALTIILVLVVIFNDPEIKKAISPVPSKTSAAAQIDYPLCAGGKYNFSRIRTGEVVIDFRLECISEVVLPFQIAFRTEPSNDVKIVFLDGQSYIDGPDRRVWYGYERSSIFTVRGINSPGIMKISLGEKKRR